MIQPSPEGEKPDHPADRRDRAHLRQWPLGLGQFDVVRLAKKLLAEQMMFGRR